MKERPLDKGIPILLAGASDVDLVAGRVPDLARDFMARYWPGPLTIIVRRRAGLPAVLAPGPGAMALRGEGRVPWLLSCEATRVGMLTAMGLR